MRINIPIELTDETRRRVRAFFGRGGLCTRNEYRIWLNKQLDRGYAELPPAKVRACNTSRMKAIKRAGEHAAELEMALVCARCGQTKGEHLRHGRECRPSKGIKPGSEFVMRQVVEPGDGAA